MEYLTLTKEDLFLVIEEITNKSIVSKKQRFIEDLKFDSMDTVTFLSVLEVDYNCYIPDDKVMDLQTIQSVIDYLKL